MKNIKRILISLILVSFCLFGVACGEKSNEFTGFLKGYLETVEIGNTVILDEYIDYVSDGKYTITATKGEETVNLSKRKSWDPSEIGEWTIVYKIVGGANNGEYSIKLNVVSPRLNFTYTVTNDNTTVEKGSTLNFEEFFSTSGINVSIESWYENCTVAMESVLIDGERIDISDKDSFTFEELTNHYFRFYVSSPDGQRKTGVVEIKVAETDSVAKQWIQENDVKVYGYSSFDENLKLSLNKGTHGSSFSNNDIPYIAYKGSYGLNSFVKFDFTGNNLPRVAFFVDEVTASIVDGNKGIYVANGHSYNSGVYAQEAEYNSLTAYGPYKVKTSSFTSSVAKLNVVGSPGNPSAISRGQLKDGVKYRYILGFIDAKETLEEDDKIIEYGYATFRALLVNLDSGEIVFDYEGKCSIGDTQLKNGLSFDEGYFKGSIIAYGGFGCETVFDKVYSVYTDVTDIYALSGLVGMNTSCDNYYKDTGRYLSSTSKYARVNEELSVSDYILNDGASYDFGYIKESDVDYSTDVFASENFVKITSDKFSINSLGEYRLFYRETNSDKHFSSMRLTVLDGLMRYDFENGNSDMISLEGSGSNSYKKSIDETTYSSKTLKIALPPVGTNQYFQIRLAKEYLEKLFEDETVTSVKVDFLLNVDRAVTILKSDGAAKESSFAANEWHTISIDRASYEYYKTSYKNSAYTVALLVRGIGGLPDDLYYIYLDNIRAERLYTAYVSDYAINDFEMSTTANVTKATLNDVEISYSLSNGVFKIVYDVLKQNIGNNNLKLYSDDTLVYEATLEVLTDTVDFEDGKESSAIADITGATFGVEKNSALQGEYLYAIKNQTSNAIKIYFDFNYVKTVFADTSVQYLAFDIKTPYGLYGFNANGGVEAVGAGANIELLSIKDDNVVTIGVKREVYEYLSKNSRTDCYVLFFALIGEEFTNATGNANVGRPGNIYIDNIRPYKQEGDFAPTVDFEDGQKSFAIANITGATFSIAKNDALQGEYLYAMQSQSSNAIKIFFNLDYVKTVFADSSVQYLAFDIKTPYGLYGFAANTGVGSIDTHMQLLEEKEGNVVTIGVKRDYYEYMLNNSKTELYVLLFALNGEEIGRPEYIYVDNFRPYTATETAE